jgi:hypothetical protein
MKYQIIAYKRGYAIRNILDGYIEFTCQTRREAENIFRKLTQYA